MSTAHPAAPGHAFGRGEPDILLVDDDPSIVQAMSRALSGVGRVRFATSGALAMRLMGQATPDLILLDAEMADMSGFELCAQLKSEAALAEIPVIFVTSHSEPAFEIGGFMAGASDFIAKPVDPRLLRLRVQAQLRTKAMADELRRVCSTDALTGLGNRRSFDAALQQEWRRSWRAGEPLSLAMVDIDHFKRFNDAHGHPAGDECLRLVGQALASACQRGGDAAFRYGGEEFALLLPNTRTAGAEHMGWRLLRAVDALALEHRGSPLGQRVSVSVGITSYDEGCPLWREPAPGEAGAGALAPEASWFADMLATCDRALYLAKRRGRGQACTLPFGVAVHDTATDGHPGVAAHPPAPQ